MYVLKPEGVFVEIWKVFAAVQHSSEADMSDTRAAEALKKQQALYNERWAAVNGAQARAGAPEPLPKAEADAVTSLSEEDHATRATRASALTPSSPRPRPRVRRRCAPSPVTATTRR